MRDLICHVVNYCALSFDMGNVYDQIVIKTWKGEEIDTNQFFYMNFHVKDNLRMEFTV